MTCRKVKHFSRKHAKGIAKAMALKNRDHGLDVYECESGCPKGTWHVGHSNRKRSVA